MIKTRGLTHLGLAVRNAEKTLRFYEHVFGVKVVYREAGQIQVQTPGSHDILAFQEKTPGAGEMGGITHFGFRLQDPKDIDAAAKAVEGAGGKIIERGEFVPGEPYIFFKDPDGYVVEVWYE